jgi:hypothetical protein
MKKLLITPEGTFELELTAQEIAQREQDAVKAEQDRVIYEAEKQAKIQAKTSALAKLTALGLTEEEVKSIL